MDNLPVKYKLCYKSQMQKFERNMQKIYLCQIRFPTVLRHLSGAKMPIKPL